MRSSLVRSLSLLSPLWLLSLHQVAVLGLRWPSLAGLETLSLEGGALLMATQSLPRDLRAQDT